MKSTLIFAVAALAVAGCTSSGQHSAVADENGTYYDSTTNGYGSPNSYGAPDGNPTSGSTTTPSPGNGAGGSVNH